MICKVTTHPKIVNTYLRESTEKMKAALHDSCRTCSVDGRDVLPAEAMAEVHEDAHLPIVRRHDAHEVWKFLLV